MREILWKIWEIIQWVAHEINCGNNWSRLRQLNDGRFYIECGICKALWIEDRRIQ